MSRPLKNNITLLTGTRGSGKTTWCEKSVSIAKENGLHAVGLLSPAIFHDAKKIGIDLVDIATGEQRPLARRCAQSSRRIRLGVWCFNAATLDWGNQILQELKNHNLIFLDELGPLEFEKGLGLQEGLHLIDAREFVQAFIVIRPELLITAQARWPEAKVIDISSVKPKLQELIQGTV